MPNNVNESIPRPGPVEETPECPVCGERYDYWHPVSEGSVLSPTGRICPTEETLYIHGGSSLRASNKEEA